MLEVIGRGEVATGAVPSPAWWCLRKGRLSPAALGDPQIKPRGGERGPAVAYCRSLPLWGLSASWAQQGKALKRPVGSAWRARSHSTASREYE
jgi:hypothetical protein